MPRHSASQRPAWLRPRFVVAFVVASAGLVAAIWLPTRNDRASATERNGGHGNDGRQEQDRSLRAFSDDFEGRRGSAVDPTKWSVQTDAQFSRNAGFSQNAQNSGSARLDGEGNLVLTAQAGGFSLARLLTKDTLRATAGHVEARIKTPSGEGVTPAFQLVSSGRSGGGTLDLLTEPGSDDFHTYAVDWTPDEVVLSVDGQESRRVRLDDQAGSQSFRLSLSLSPAFTSRGTGTTSQSSARMLVDSVSFESDGATEAPTTPAPTDDPTTPPGTDPTDEPSSDPPSSEPPSSEPTTTPPTTEPPAATEWAPFTDYIAGQLVTYKDVEYQVLETHTSLPGWEPTALPNLFREL